MRSVSPEGEGPLFQDNRANTWGRPALVLALGIVAVVLIAFLALVIIGVIF